MRACCVRHRGKIDGSDQFTRLQIGVNLRSGAGQPVKISHGDRPRPARSLNLNYGLQCCESDAHIAGVNGDALRTRAEDGMDAIESLESGATASWSTLIAFAIAGIVEVIATRALHQVAAHGGHVAQLLRGSGEESFTQNGVAFTDQWMRRGVGVARHSSDAYAALVLFDRSERDPGDIDQRDRRARHPFSSGRPGLFRRPGTWRRG